MFNITILQGDLLSALATTERVVARKLTIPVLGNVLLEANGNELLVSATDIEIALRRKVVVQGTFDGGAVTLSSRNLYELARTLPPGDVKLVADGANVKITAGAFRASMATLPVEDFPTLTMPPETGVTVSLPRAVLRESITRVRFACDESDSRFFIAGAFLTRAGGNMRLVTTDGHRMAIADSTAVAEFDDAILPRRTVDLLASMLDSEGPDVMFTRGNNHLFFTVGETVIVSRMIDGKYPEYKRFIPKLAPTLATVDRRDFLSALRRVATMTRRGENQRVIIEFQQNGLKLSTQGSEGEGVDEIAAVYSGDSFRVAYNVGYLIEYLNAVTAASVSLSVKKPDDPTKPEQALLKAGEGEPVDYTYILMPLVI